MQLWFRAATWLCIEISYYVVTEFFNTSEIFLRVEETGSRKGISPRKTARYTPVPPGYWLGIDISLDIDPKIPSWPLLYHQQRFELTYSHVSRRVLTL